MSILDSTRKDFEELLSSHEFSSNQSGSSEKEKSHTRKSKKKLLKKQRHREEDTQPLELVQIKKKNKLSSSSSEDGEAYVNQLFWYEEEKILVKEQVKKQTDNDLKNTISASNPSLNSAVQRESKSNHSKSIKSANSRKDSTSATDKSSTESPVSKASTSKSKKSSRSQKSTRRSTSNETEKSQKENVRLSNGLLKIIIHHTDQLIFDHPDVRPMVVVHLINRESGNYITNNGSPVPPQFTASWSAKNGTSSAAVWNQELLFSLDSSSSLETLLVFFDLVSEPSSDQKSHLAWGFLRPVSRLGVKHLDKKIQIQLYRLPLRQLLHQAKATVTDLFSWYQSPQKDKYPSTLHASLRFETQENVSAQIDANLGPLINLGSPLRRGRLNGQPFRLPTRRKFTFTNSSGCLVSCYSSDGKFLAFALTCGEINVHGNAEAPVKLNGHLGNVYDLDWNCTGSEALLLSCGTDCTARVWIKKNCIVLPHPAYVYAARFGPENRIATGSFDQLVRLWEFNLHELNAQLISSYANHTSPVNAICWNVHKLFSADAAGLICVWSNEESGLHFESSLGSSNESLPINSLFLHPNGNRMLIHHRGGDLFLIDVKSGLKLVNYSGIYNQRLKITSSITPCGHYVVSGSEDGSIYWFDLERGDLVAIMSFQSAKSQPVPSVAFHPHEHLMAICSLSPELSVVLAEFNANDTQVFGFSMVTFPRTVQSAAHSVSDFSKRSGRLDPIGGNNTTPTLDKLERIFKKLDLVMAWSKSVERPAEN